MRESLNMSLKKRKICVVTGSRAEYGLLYWIMKGIASDPAFDLQIVATGTHLSPEFGLTYKIIEEDGFQLAAKVEMLLSSDTQVGIAKSLGLGVIGFAETLDRLRPDLVVVLGDRYEIFAATQAALVARIPVAHLHGGETTEGCIDEAIRHSITKMSHLHFVAAEAYRDRVAQLGEDPNCIYNFGAPGLDNFERLKLLDRHELERALNFELGTKNFLVTYHPVTLEARSPAVGTEAMLDALDRFPDAKIIFTKGNADTEGRIINLLIDDYAAKNPERALSVTSLGQVRYLSLLKQVDAVIGNSSSGLVEAPVAKTATVNIGARQRGRLKAASVIDCDETIDGIAAAIQKALSAEFRATLPGVRSLYGSGKASERVVQVLKTVSLDGILMKSFHDKGKP